MTDIVETVARAIEAKWAELAREAAEDDPPRFNARAIASAAINVYEAAKLEQEMNDQRLVWEAAKRVQYSPASTPLYESIINQMVKKR
jgi:hypothetical protein